MSAGYTRQSSSAIVTNGVINASDFNNEYNALQSAFDATTGHSHDSTIGGGAPISLTASVTGTLPIANGGTNLITYTLGDVLYSSAADTLAKLAGNTTTTKKFLQQTGTGTVSAAPSWGQPAFTDITGTAAVNQGGTGQTSYTDGQLLIGNSTGNTLTKTTLTAGTGVTITNGAGAITVSVTSSTYQPLDADLTALAGISTTGFLKRTGSGTAATASIDLTADITATLPSANGGTGFATYTLGDLLYCSASNTLSKLAGNITTTKKFFAQTGTGTASAAPAWTTIASTDVTGLGTAATKDVGTSANNVVQLDASSKLPAVDGSQLTGIPVFLVGMIMPYAGTTAPTGWQLCDGTALSRTTEASLFAVISTTYGTGDGTTTFNVPNLCGRTPIGSGTGSGLTARTLGSTGGEETHLLTTTELPSHTHTGTTGTESANHTHTGSTTSDGTHTHTVTGVESTGGVGVNGVNGGGTGSSAVTSSDGSHAHTVSLSTESAVHTHSFTTAATGGGAAHNVMQPFLTINYIIKK